MLADNDIKSQIHNMQCQRQMFNLILSVKIRHFFFLSWILKNFKFSFKKFSINNIQKVHVKRPPDHRRNSTESPNALVTLRKSVLLKLFFFFLRCSSSINVTKKIEGALSSYCCSHFSCLNYGL